VSVGLGVSRGSACLLTPHRLCQRTKRRKTRLEHKIRHTFGLLNKLKGEEYRLLDEVEPIQNAMEWHDRCARLLDEKTRLNRLLKCGLPKPAAGPAAPALPANPGGAGV